MRHDDNVKKKKAEEDGQVIKNLTKKIDKLSGDNAKLEDETKIKDEKIANLDVIIKGLQKNDVTEREECKQREIKERKELIEKLEKRKEMMNKMHEMYELDIEEQRKKLEELEELEDNDEENNESKGNRVSISQSMKRHNRPGIGSGDNNNDISSHAKKLRQ